MRVLTLHLSDLHFSDDQESVAQYRAREIAEAAMSSIPGVHALLTICTGDFIEKGGTEGFIWAKMFFDELEQNISRIQPHVDILGRVFTPGNHDLNLPTDMAGVYARKKAISDLLSRAKTPSPDEDAVQICVRAQEEYFAFDVEATQRTISDARSKLAFSRTFPAGSNNIEVLAVNTSWMCTGGDDYGDLLAWCPDQPEQRGACFRIVALHHPLDWLRRPNERHLGRVLRPQVDLILSGHEHDGQRFVRYEEARAETITLEGDALSGPGGKSGFDCLVLDFDRNERKILVFRWQGDRYAEHDIKLKEWAPLRRGLASRGDGFVLTQEFQELLDDPGVSAARSNGATLDDIFVYPKLRDITFESRRTHAGGSSLSQERRRDDGLRKKGQDKFVADSVNIDPVISSAALVGNIVQGARLVLVGDERSGKTALLRKLFHDLRESDYVPVLLSLSGIKKFDVDSMHTALRKAAHDQYMQPGCEAFFGTEQRKRAVLIDDLGQANITPPQLKELLSSCEELAGISILAGDELLLLRAVWAAMEGSDVLNYRIYRLLQIDHRQQKELAAKMQKVIKPHDLVGEDNAALADVEKNLDIVMGGGLVVPFPGAVMAIISDLLDGNATLGAEYGAYGFFYDHLIKSSVAEGLANLPKEEAEPLAGIVESFLAELAFGMHNRNSTAASENDVDAHIEAFHKQKHRINKSALLRFLKAAHLIVRENDEYRFRERYQRYYFMAVKLRDLLSDDGTSAVAKEILIKAISNIHESENAEVLLFVFYFTRSTWLLQRVLHRARSILDNVQPCDMDEDFLQFDPTEMTEETYNQLRETSRDAEVQQGKTGTPVFSENEIEAPDDANPHAIQTVSSEMGGAKALALDEQLAVTLRNMSEAFNTMNVISQAVRNYPTKIDVEVRRSLIGEAYELGLKAYSEFIDLINRGRAELDDLSRKHLRVSPVIAVNSALDSGQIAARLVALCGFGVVRRLSDAVASPSLQELLTEVGAEKESVAIKMIRASVLLDLRRIPISEIEAFYKDLDHNFIARFILANVVAQHLRRYRAVGTRRLHLCKAVNIDPGNPALFYSNDKPRSLGER